MGGWYIPAPASPTGTAPMLLHVLRPEYMYGAYEDVDVDVGCFVFMFKVHTTLVGHVTLFHMRSLISVVRGGIESSYVYFSRRCASSWIRATPVTLLSRFRI